MSDVAGIGENEHSKIIVVQNVDKEYDIAFNLWTKADGVETKDFFSLIQAEDIPNHKTNLATYLKSLRNDVAVSQIRFGMLKGEFNKITTAVQKSLNEEQEKQKAQQKVVREAELEGVRLKRKAAHEGKMSLPDAKEKLAAFQASFPEFPADSLPTQLCLKKFALAFHEGTHDGPPKRNQVLDSRARSKTDTQVVDLRDIGNYLQTLSALFVILNRASRPFYGDIYVRLEKMTDNPTVRLKFEEAKALMAGFLNRLYDGIENNTEDSQDAFKFAEKDLKQETLWLKSEVQNIVKNEENAEPEYKRQKTAEQKTCRVCYKTLEEHEWGWNSRVRKNMYLWCGQNQQQKGEKGKGKGKSKSKGKGKGKGKNTDAQSKQCWACKQWGAECKHQKRWGRFPHSTDPCRACGKAICEHADFKWCKASKEEATEEGALLKKKKKRFHFKF